MDAPLETRNSELEGTGPVFSQALRSSLGRVPVWLLVWAGGFILALAVAIPWYSFFDNLVTGRYKPGMVSGSLDVVFRQDHRAGLDALNSATAQSASILAFVAMLLGVFSAGGWLQVVLERTRGQSIRRFLFGGAQYFWRFLRVLILTLLIMLFIGWIVYDDPFREGVLGRLLGVAKSDWGKLETLDSEETVVAIRAAQDGVYLLCFSLVMCWADYTRTRLALQGTHSAVWAGLTTFFTMLRHPIKSLRPLVALVIIELIVLILGGFAIDWLQADFVGPNSEAAITTGQVWVLGLVSQLVMMLRCVIRGARYHVTTIVSQSVVRPLSRPDPWRESIGGPGGPRYPLEEGDEYGVAL
jgi:hypothetical protein